MTRKGGHNHYNIKFLSGYGLSVSLKDSKIVLKNGIYPHWDIQEKDTLISENPATFIAS